MLSLKLCLGLDRGENLEPQFRDDNISGDIQLLIDGHMS